MSKNPRCSLNRIVQRIRDPANKSDSVEGRGGGKGGKREIITRKIEAGGLAGRGVNGVRESGWSHVLLSLAQIILYRNGSE